jgi:hypothetical protein
MRTIYTIASLLVLCATVALAGIAPTKGKFEGLYRRDRWGDGRFAHFLVSPDLHKKLKPYEGQYVTIWVRKAIQHANPGPATLYKVWSVKKAPVPKTYLGLTSRIDPGHFSPSTPFAINIFLTNSIAHPVKIASHGTYIRVTGETRDPMENHRHWTNLWQNHRRYPSHTGTTLIATCGFLNWKDGVVNCPTGGTMHDLPLAAGASTNLSLPFTNGLPVGKYEVEIGATAYPNGDDTKSVRSRTWLTFEIEETTVNE